MKAKINNKYKNATLVEVLEDFNPIKAREAAAKPPKDVKGKVLFEKGSQHAIHKRLLKKLSDKGLKHKVVKVDFEQKHEEARVALRKKRKSVSDE